MTRENGRLNDKEPPITFVCEEYGGEMTFPQGYRFFDHEWHESTRMRSTACQRTIIEKSFMQSS